MEISVIGAGNMGSALVRGLVASETTIPRMVRIFDVNPFICLTLQNELGVLVGNEAGDTIRPETRFVVLAVKPQVLGEVLDSLADRLHDSLVIVSIAAGITTEFILSRLKQPARVIRAMPNAGALVQASATALCKAGTATDRDLQDAVELFRSIGVAVTVEEKMMNVVTALSGSGPGYLFAIMEAFSDGAVLMGLDRATARALTVQTFLSAAAMASAGNAPFSELKDRITSPGGTTITGLKTMERAGIRGTLMEVVEAATKRANELAGGK